MKAEITSDGELTITSQNPTEDYAIKSWIRDCVALDTECERFSIAMAGLYVELCTTESAIDEVEIERDREIATIEAMKRQNKS